MTVVGGSTDHLIVKRNGDVQADAVLEVQTVGGVAVTDLTAPSGWTGLPFPAGKARADGDGYFKFVVPDATGPVQVRTAAHTEGTKEIAAGPWLTPSGQIVPDSGLEQALAGRTTPADVDAKIATQAAADSATYAPVETTLTTGTAQTVAGRKTFTSGILVTEANTKVINDKLSFASHADRGGDAPTYTPVIGEHTANGQLRVFSQLSTQFHDLVLMPGSAHADLHLSRLTPSYKSQLVTITGAPTGGSFTLTYGGQTTTPLPYNVAPTAVQAALVALSSLADHRVYVHSATGDTALVGGPWTISVTDPDAKAITATSSLTGGSSPGVTVAQSTPDGALYIDIPINGTIPVTGTILGKRSTGHLEFKLGETGGAFDFLSAAGATLLAVNNAGLLSLGTLSMSGGADLPKFFGGGSSGGIAFMGSAGGAGTGGLIRFRDNPTENNTGFQVDTGAPPSGRTAIAVRYHNGTAIAFQYATVGAADSGGAGFRAIRVPN